MSRILLAIVLLVLSWHLYAQEEPNSSQKKKNQAAQDEIITIFRKENYEERDHPDVIQFIDRTHARVFLVTKEEHPAHPAVVTRQMMEKDGHIFIKMDGKGLGDKRALQIWIDHMASEDKRDAEATSKK